MDDLLLPQRKLKSLKISTKENPSASRDFALQSVIPRAPHQNMYDMGMAGQQYVKNYSGSGKRNEVMTQEEPKITFEELFTRKKCPFHELLSAKHLVILAATNKSLRRYFLLLNFNYRVRFHDFASIVRAGRGYGILDSCALHIGDEDEVVNEDDLSFMCTALQSPKTQISCTILAFSFQISADVYDKLVQDFLRSMKYPTLLPLETLNLEGSLIGTNGVKCLCNILKKNYLPNLKTLNINRNQAGYKGIHCLQQVLLGNTCPLLKQLSISDNHAGLSVLEFLGTSILKSRELQLMALDISTNDVDLADSQSVHFLINAVINLSTLTELDLSFNPLNDDAAFRFFSQVWPLEKRSEHDVLPIRRFAIQHSSIGNRTLCYIGDLMCTGRMRYLEALYVGMNEGSGKVAIESILAALCTNETKVESIDTPGVLVPCLRELSVPLNRFGNDGMLAIMNAAVVGGFKQLEMLDVSDIGATTEHINVFLRNFIKHGQYTRLRRLVVFGRHPFASNRAKGLCTDEFLQQVKVS